jgi:hypothetical protein
MSDLLQLLKIEGKEISQLFDKASIEGKGTPQEISDRREKVLIDFIKKYFPFPYRITKGNIVDSYNARSASIDCLILNPNHPYTTTDDSKYSIILADGVDCAIELKPDLNSEVEIFRALNQIVTVKKLRRKNSGLVFLKKYSVEYQETCKQIPCFIFSNKTYCDEVLLMEKIVTYYEKNKITKDLQFDFLIVNNRFIITNSREHSYFHLKRDVPNGLYILDLGELTLAAFLFYLNHMPKSEPEISQSILKHYMTIKPENIRNSEALNERLRKIDIKN